MRANAKWSRARDLTPTKLIRSDRVLNRIVLLVLRGRSRGFMRRALLKPEASGPEAIEPDSVGESRHGPGRPEIRWYSPQLR